jgi:DNA polymerase-1
MGNSVLDILNNINNDHPPHPNDKILLIDGLNLYIRAFSANGAVNDKGVPVGGMVGFLKSLALLIREINPTRIIVTFDGKGGSKRRRKLHPGYKGNRKPGKRLTRWDQFQTVEDEQYSMATQLSRLSEYLENLPLTTIVVDNIEADDIISYLVTTIFKENDKCIASGDQDFLQLVDEKTTVWSPSKKRFFTPTTVLEEYNIPSYNFLIYKSLLGDQSDNINGVRGLGPKKIPKLLPEIINSPLSITDVVEYASTQKGEMFERITNSEDNLHLNYKLMNLQETNISGYAKVQIMEDLEHRSNLLDKNSFIRLYNNDFLGDSLGRPEQWLNNSFLRLNTLLKQLTNE